MTTETDAPLITIGVPCFNCAGTVERALRSAIAQDWPACEILVVDDASDDHTLEVIRSVACTCQRLRVEGSDVNQGVGAVRQRILLEARGEFVAFFDDDDESTTDRISVQYATIMDYEWRTGGRNAACYATGVRRYPNGYERHLQAIGSTGPAPCGEEVADYLLFYGHTNRESMGSGTPACALMARREVFLSVGGFDPNMRRVEDVDWAIRFALAKGCFIGSSKRLFVQYHTHGGDKSPRKNMDAECALAHKYRAYLVRKRRYVYARMWPVLRYHYFRRNYARLFATVLALACIHPVSVPKHILSTGMRRMFHEVRMKR